MESELWEQLGITDSSKRDYKNAKEQFRKLSIEFANNKSRRAKIGVAYHSIQYGLNNDTWNDKTSDIFYFIITG